MEELRRVHPKLFSDAVSVSFRGEFCHFAVVWLFLELRSLYTFQKDRSLPGEVRIFVVRFRRTTTTTTTLDFLLAGLAEWTIRTRFNDPKVGQHLREAFKEIHESYPDGSEFELICTGNAILKGVGPNGRGNTFRVWHGVDYDEMGAKGGILLHPVYKLKELDDLEHVDLANCTNEADFVENFQANFGESNVSVLMMLNHVFVIRKFLDDFQRDRTHAAPHLKLL